MFYYIQYIKTAHIAQLSEHHTSRLNVISLIPLSSMGGSASWSGNMASYLQRTAFLQLLMSSMVKVIVNNYIYELLCWNGINLNKNKIKTILANLSMTLCQHELKNFILLQTLCLVSDPVLVDPGFSVYHGPHSQQLV